ncbi:MAG: hypothetical protein KAS72_08215 [Phycisphaerales bacterium]|nr:hypothetical protein [Phycisphaerales bacterium]
MDAATVRRLELSYDAIRPRAHDLAESVYERLARQLPQLQSMCPDDANTRRQRVMSMLTLILTNASTPGCFVHPYQSLLDADGLDWEIQEQHGTIARILVEAMAATAGNMWTRQLTSDWTQAMAYVGQTPEVFYG